MTLREQIEQLAARETNEYSDDEFALFAEFKSELNRGTIRAAERDAEGRWQTNAWVKRGILLGFRMGTIVDMSSPDGSLQFLDKHTYPIKRFSPADRVRIVPGGSSIRDAASQIGGVLEPAGAMPVIIEDDCIVGGNCGVYEGAIVRERAVLASGTIITGSTPLFDLVRKEIYRRSGDAPLEIPSGAVVVPGSRALQIEKGREWGLSLYAPVIVKYRDDKTDAATQLEDLLR